MSELSGRTSQQEVPTREQIAQRAYELYEQRGCGQGKDLEDWLTAEKELRSRNTFVARASSSQDVNSSTLIGSTQKQTRAKAAVAFGSKSLDGEVRSKF